LDGQATGNDYAWSVAYLTEIAGWNTEFNIGGSQQFDGDNFVGASVLAYKEVYENLELVGRLAYANGDHGDALDGGGRYSRNSITEDADINDADYVFNAYLGLNYYFAGNNSKILLGAEVDVVNEESNVEGNTSAITLAAAYRMKF